MCVVQELFCLFLSGGIFLTFNTFLTCMCRSALSWRLDRTSVQILKNSFSVSVPSSSGFCPENPATLAYQKSKLYFLNSKDYWALLGFILIVLCPGNPLHAVNLGTHRTHLICSFSSMEDSLVSSLVQCLKTAVSYILSVCLVVKQKGKSDPSFPEAKVWDAKFLCIEYFLLQQC